MTRLRRNVAAWALAGILLCSPLSGGCDVLSFFGPNFSMDIVIPLGLGGSPGLLNPFGAVQAAVNAMLGLDSSSEEGDTGYSNPAAAPTSTGQQFNPAVTAVLP